jgi:hypothetical protein
MKNTKTKKTQKTENIAMSDTPETDDLAYREAVSLGHPVWEFAKKLERERNRALVTARFFFQSAQELERERDEVRTMLACSKTLAEIVRDALKLEDRK